MRQKKTPPATAFSPREIAILRLVARGWTNREIAAEVGLKPATVRTYISDIMAKVDLELPRRTCLALYAVEHGLGPDSSDLS